MEHFIVDPPSAPQPPRLFPKSLTSAVLSWISPIDSLCVTIASYTITLTNITEGNVSYMYNTTTNATSMAVFDLTQGAEYSFIVAWVDAEGRVGENSMSSNTVLLKSE